MDDASKELCLAPERPHERRAALHRAQTGAGVMAQLTEVASTEVRHGVRLEVRPDVLDRIELGSIGRQVLEGDRAALFLDVLTYELGAMRLQPVPDDQKLASDRGMKGFQELDHLRGLDRAVEETEVEPQGADPSHHRELLPAEGVLQDRRLAPGSPGACAAGTFGKTRLVYEDDDSSLPRGDFFRAGHLLAFQLRIAPSSRSRARPVGRCTLQPIPASNRHTELGTRCTPNFSSIKVPMRLSVHISVEYPAAIAPCFNSCASSRAGPRRAAAGGPARHAGRACRSPPLGVCAPRP